MKLNNRYIGCNHSIAYYGGIDSSFNGIFNKEEVLIEHGIGDIIPCMIGDVSEAYEILEKKKRLKPFLLYIKPKITDIAILH